VTLVPVKDHHCRCGPRMIEPIALSDKTSRVDFLHIRSRQHAGNRWLLVLSALLNVAAKSLMEGASSFLSCYSLHDFHFFDV
jgi:hypothetical protein